MIASLPPGVILMCGALLLPLVPARGRGYGLVLLAGLSMLHMLGVEAGVASQLHVFGYELTLVRADKLSMAFGYVFHIAALLGAIYALHVRDTVQSMASAIYAGSAIAALFAGDLISLFVFWEITAVSSVFLVWASRTERSYRAGMRYMIIQVGSGVLLLAGCVIHFADTGSLAFDRMTLDVGHPATVLIFLAFGIKCAFPFLHNWLQDTYPEATVTGTVFLSAFTTKLAIYALARGFPGTSELIVIGVVMTLFPIVFAVIENDLRKVLAYSLNNQLGFMVVGIGIGTEMAINGTVAHAFCHILYKSLLFMSMGAVLYRTGTIKATQLGGLYKSMPITTVCCIIGAASIAGFPLFSGFISKSMILTAAAEGHYMYIWLGLLVASAGVMEHSGIKIPFFAFFGHDSGVRCKEAPRHMLVAMVITAGFCVALGCYPAPLYSLLPYEVDYAPYTGGHVVMQLQLLLFAALAFVVLIRTGIYPPETASTNLDFDWFYRKPIPAVVGFTYRAVGATRSAITTTAIVLLHRLLDEVRNVAGSKGMLGSTWTTGTMVLWAAILLGVYLLVYYL